MNQAAHDLQASMGNEHQLRQQVMLVAVFGAVAFLALMLPLQSLHIPPQHYLPLHTLLEFLAILAAFLVFATVWHTPAKEVSASLLMIAVALFAAGWLDFSHALSFKGMPDLISPASIEKSIAFWLGARLIVAITLLGVSFYPLLKAPSSKQRLGILAAYTVLNMVVIWAVIFHEADLPETFIEGSGLTAFKIGGEWLISSLLVFAAVRYYREARRSDDPFLPLIFGAAAIAAMSELFLTQYEDYSDVMNLLGHLYKCVSYGLIYQAMFVVSVNRPYQKLSAQTQVLQRANETLRTQSLALDSTATPVLVADIEGKVHWRNRSARELTPVLFPGHEDTLSLFSAPLTPNPKMAGDIHATVQAGKIWRGFVDIKDSLGKKIIFDRTVTPLRNEEGVIEGYVAVAENVTEKLQALLRHKRVLDTAIDGFWVVDASGQLLEVNEAYARMSGYTIDELLTMNVSQLEALERQEDVQAHMSKIARQGHDQFETRHHHKRGHDIAVDISATYDPESRNFFVFTRDRSEYVQSAAAKKDLERQLQQSQKMQALGQMTGGIAHDFNNILASILGYSNLALERLVPDKQSKLATYLSEVITASERARDLIAKMLTFTRTQPSAGAGVISPATVIQEVVAMMRPSIPSGIQLKSRIDEDLHIRMDAGELNQVLVNLVINARDALDGQGTIDICQHRVVMTGQICAANQQRLSGAYLALDVSDNGSGIAPEHMLRLFDPFFTTKDVGKGTGLGLSMVQGILRRSNGHIVVESQPGRGSRFELLFPIVRPTDSSPEESQADPTARLGLGQCIWVVDDEPAIARYMGELLEDCGYRVRTFNQPSQVLTAFETEINDVDLVITDQTMPGWSGVTLAQHLRELKPDLPIVLCTGYSDDLDQAELRQKGISHCFNKPISTNDLLRALAEELGQKKS